MCFLFLNIFLYLEYHLTRGGFMIKLSENINEGRSNTKKIIIGSGISIAITIILLVIYASLLSFTSISETTIQAVTTIITIVSILIGSSLSTLKLKKNGIINGVIISIIYIGLIYFFSSIIEGNFTLNTKSIIMIIGGIFAGAIGGIIGVNKK